MKWKTIFILLLFISQIPSSNFSSQTHIILEPHIGEDYITVTQIYEFEGEGLKEFEILTIALSYVNLRVFDSEGELDYEVGENILIGKDIFRKIKVYFRKPLEKSYSFTVRYEYETTGTGKPVAGKYRYNLKSVTDTTRITYKIPLKDIVLTEESRIKPVEVRRGEETIVEYFLKGDANIVLAYEVPDLDYSNTKKNLEEVEVHGRKVEFEVVYPEKAEVLAEDVLFFAKKMFPKFIQLIGMEPNFQRYTVYLKKEENSWAAARYYGKGVIEIYINNTASYPSSYLTHEIAHSYIKNVPMFLEEGLADYFEYITERDFRNRLEGDRISSREWYWQTYERQYQEIVDVTKNQYGLALTEKQESLIYSKYSKGAYIVFEISRVLGHETVKEIVKFSSEKDFEDAVYSTQKSRGLVRILNKFGFDLLPEEKYLIKGEIEDLKSKNWWNRILFLKFTDSKLKWESSEKLTSEIHKTEDFSKKTYLFANLGLIFILFLFSFEIFKNRNRIENRIDNALKNFFYLSPKPYLLIPTFVLASLSFILYQLLINGAKPAWLFKELFIPFSVFFIIGALVMVFVGKKIEKNFEILISSYSKVKNVSFFEALGDLELNKKIFLIEELWVFPFFCILIFGFFNIKEVVLGQRFDITMYFFGYLFSTLLLYPKKKKICRELNRNSYVSKNTT